MLRGALAFLTSCLLATPAFATPKSCATMLDRVADAWALVRLPSKLHIVHQYMRGRHLAVVHHSPRNPRELRIFDWDLATNRRTFEAEVTTVPWSGGHQDAEHFRSSVLSADGRLSATTPEPLSTRVLVHPHDEAPADTSAMFFGLSMDDRAPLPEGTEEIAPYTALNLSFSPDGKHLLGHNPLGWEVHSVATRERVRSAYANALQPTQFAGWLDDDRIVEVSQHGVVWTHGPNGIGERRGALPLMSPAELVDASLVNVPEGRRLVSHSSFRPLLFEVRDPETLAIEHQLSVTHLPLEFELDWMALMPDGVAVFRLSVGRCARIGAVNIGAAIRAGRATLQWRELAGP